MAKGNKNKAPLESTSEPLELHQPCDDCGSSDALTRYTDGHTHCFSCGKTVQASGVVTDPEGDATPKAASDESTQGVIESAQINALTKRKITQSTCRVWNYRTRIGKDSKPEHVAVYCDENARPIAVKIRTEDKNFYWLGDHKKIPLYGQWLWGQGGKQVVVTEGEIDALTVSQMFGNKWPVVSVPNGAQNAKKDIAKALEWLNTFDKVILAFDMDSQGREAAEACARVLPPGKAFIATLPSKDPNAALLAGQSEELIRSIWNAKSYRPDGVVDAVDLVERALETPTSGLSWPWPFLTAWTYGRRHGEVYTFGAGTGIGKSDLINEVIAHTLTVNKEACAVFSWESSPVATLKAIAGKIAHRRFHIPDPKHTSWTQDELDVALHAEWISRLSLNDSFGAVDWDSVKDRMRFLVHAKNVRHIVLDPLTALAAAADDERKELERIMSEVAGMAQELDVCIYLVSHLATPEGTPHEEGGRVTIRNFKGSRAIGFWSFFIFGLERDQQAAEEVDRKSTIFRCLKDRYTGESLGKTQRLHYDSISGSLDVENDGKELEPPEIEPLELEAANAISGE